MRQNIRIEDHKSEREKPGHIPKPLSCRKEHNQAKPYRKQLHAGPHPKYQMLTSPIVPGQPVTAPQVRFSLKIPALQRWYPQAVPQRWQRGKQLRQRRMFGVQSIVAGLPHHVPGKHMVVLIKGQRLPMDDRQSQSGLQQEQNNNYRP